MPVTMRPWSVNSFGLSKAWFKCHSVDLRAGDVTAITSSVKSWLYADMFEKPSETIMFRPASHGGLGVLCPKYRALACLIRTFMETAANPNFRRNQYHAQLFRYHVLEEHWLPNHGFPPYYSQHFFSMIKKVKNTTPLNPVYMTMNEWYTFLLEEKVTMRDIYDEGRKELVPCRVEAADSSYLWSEAYRLL